MTSSTWRGPPAAGQARPADLRPRLAVASTVTARSRTAPVTMNFTSESRAFRSMPFEIEPITRAPSSADQAVPRPPKRLVPPMTAAAMAFSSTSPPPEPWLTANSREAAITPPTAASVDAEAARRSGISLTRVRLIVFMLCSTLAAIGGIMAASRLFAVNQGSGGGDLLLNSIAAAVIGGTSLFGGRGTVWSALLGALVIGSISNGMDLKALDSDVKFMVTGAVLLLAVTVDATARRGRRSAGRA